MRKIHFFLRLFILVCVGLFVSFLAFSFHPRCKKYIDYQITAVFENFYKARFSGTLSFVSPFTLSIHYKNVMVIPLDQSRQWAWKADFFTLNFSLLEYLYSKKIGLSIVIDGCKGSSFMHKFDIHLLDHLALLFASSKNSLFKMTKFSLLNSFLTIEDSKKAISFMSYLESITKNSAKGPFTHIRIWDGHFFYNGQKKVSRLEGKVSCDSDVKGSMFTLVQIHALIDGLPQDKNHCSLLGHWKGKAGEFVFHNDDRSFLCAPLAVEVDKKKGIGVQLKGTFPFSYGLSLLGIDANFAGGSCSFELAGFLKEILKGTLTGTNLSYAGYELDLATTTFSFDGQSAQGACSFKHHQQQASGQWWYDANSKCFTGKCAPITLWNILGTAWNISSQKSNFSFQVNDDFSALCTYNFTAENAKTEKKIVSSGIVKVENKNAQWESTLTTQHATYACIGKTDPLSCVVKKEGIDTQPLIVIQGSKTESSGMIDACVLQEWIQELWNVKMVGMGSIHFTGKWASPGLLSGSVLFDKGMIRLLPLYNFLQKAEAHFFLHPLERILQLQKVSLSLQKGRITSDSIVLGYDYKYKKSWAHIPFVFNDCFINWGTDLYAQASGAAVFKKGFKGLATMKGFIVFDHSTLKENIFSQDIYRLITDSIRSPDAQPKVAIDCAVSTRSALHIKTAQLETTATCSLRCTSGEQPPNVRGTICIAGGLIHFPAYSLPIIKGLISWEGQEITEPVVEFFARGRIKKYLILLTVGGTATDPQIIFDAVPALSQEQIIMLLFAGSEEESLNIAVPSLVMRNVENVLFGSNAIMRTARWLKPFKRVKFIPLFTDQTGRGGFKGALEIEVSKRLRGMIEKNFSLTEDVALEVEYTITDAVSVRATRDERGDLGAELEMRFKF